MASHSPKEPARGTAVILLVDGDDCARDAMAETLRSAGYTVLEARDGLEGLGLIIEHSPNLDLLLAELRCQVVGGKALLAPACRRIPGIRAIFLTTAGDSAAGEGQELVLTKPVPEATLLEAVRRALASRARCQGGAA